MKTVVVASAVLALSCAGCVQTPANPGPLAQPAPQGIAPSASDAEAGLLAHLQLTLKDPDSIKQFRVLTAPVWSVWTGTGQWAQSWDGGWAICYELNAKNSYGGYAGLQKRAIAFDTRQGRLIPITDVNMATLDPACPA